ncbi:MAG: sigma-54-dependent Fis family transcriptional regulator [Bacteroidales bacterium]|nr:sigma-54-dependent Fis family transcriptional regulator [Bacteroidales bacterium]
MSNGRLLIVDDNSNAIKALKLFLKYEFDRVKGITNPNSIPMEFSKGEYDVVLLDMNFSAGVNNGNEGFFWLREIKKLSPITEVVMFTAYGDVELAVRAVKEGAADFIQKPWENEKMITTLKAATRLGNANKEVKKLKQQQQGLKAEINRQNKLIIGSSSAMLRLVQMVQKIATTDANVLITGENGTGKEVIAREIHRLSGRSQELMVIVDMATIPETLFESELFGHKKGAFTDAVEDKPGKFELANYGTLFLDEIGNLPVNLQSKLLVTLQNRRIIPLGGTEEVPINIRLISATNSNLDDLLTGGRFREDLMYRINTIHLEIPPLRERVQDIDALASFFLHKYTKKYNRDGLTFNKGVLNKLKEYHWPGNIRELEHTIERTVILSTGKHIRTEDIFITSSTKKAIDLPETMQEMEKMMIVNALNKHEGNYSSAATQLGITRQTLYNKGKKYGI